MCIRDSHVPLAIPVSRQRFNKEIKNRKNDNKVTILLLYARRKYSSNYLTPARSIATAGTGLHFPAGGMNASEIPVTANTATSTRRNFNILIT